MFIGLSPPAAGGGAAQEEGPAVVDNDRGLAEAALRNIVAIAFGELGLHRRQAETLQHNLRSQRLLERTGFTRYGLAPSYLRIAGEWQDFLMYQLLNPDERRRV